MINVGSQKPNIGGTDLQGNERFTENSNEKIFEGQSYWWFEREIAWCYKWLMLQRKKASWVRSWRLLQKQSGSWRSSALLAKAACLDPDNWKTEFTKHQIEYLTKVFPQVTDEEKVSQRWTEALSSWRQP